MKHVIATSKELELMWEKERREKKNFKSHINNRKSKKRKTIMIMKNIYEIYNKNKGVEIFFEHVYNHTYPSYIYLDI